MSEISKLIDRVAREALSDVLRAADFRKDGRTWRRTLGEAIQVVNVQASTSNAGAAGRFALNAGVYFHSLAVCLGTGALTDRPMEYDCHVRCRVASLAPDRSDRWWEVTLTMSDEQRDAVASDLRLTFERFGRPWLDGLGDIRSVRDELVRRSDFLVASAASLVLGDRIGAEQYAESAIRTRPASAGHVRWWRRDRRL